LDPFTNEYYQNNRSFGWHIDALGSDDGQSLGIDTYGGHIQPDGTYHYHTVRADLLEYFGVAADAHSPLLGYASDGFPVYGLYGYTDAEDASSESVELTSSYTKNTMRSGTNSPSTTTYPLGTYIEDYTYFEGLGDLNDANARFCVTPEYPDGTWCYFITSDFPYVPIKLLGTADDSFNVETINTHSHPTN
jgi:hypothetical protein